MSDLPATAAPVGDLVRAGATRHELRGRQWRHPYHGVARANGLDEQHPLTRIQDVLPLMPGCGLLGGWSAMFWLGVDYIDGLTRAGVPVPVRMHTCSKHRRIRRPGLDPTRRRLHGDELMRFAGVRVTTLPRAVYDEMCLAASLWDAVVVLELAVSRVTTGPRTELATVQDLVDRHVKTRGIARARQALTMASERSASPLETRTRLVVADRFPGLTAMVNRPVFARDGALLGIPDLADPVTGVVLESDGAVHRTLERVSRDHRRDDDFAAANMTCVRVTSEDHQQPHRLKDRVRRAYARAQTRVASQDQWTFDPPPWWRCSPHSTRWG